MWADSCVVGLLVNRDIPDTAAVWPGYQILPANIEHTYVYLTYVWRVRMCYRTLNSAAELNASNFTLVIDTFTSRSHRTSSHLKRESHFQADFMKLCWFPVFFMSLASPLVHCLKLTRSKSILSRFAVPITLVVINTFMMSTSAEGAYDFKGLRLMPTKISVLT